MAGAKKSQSSLDSFFKRDKAPPAAVSNRPSSTTARQAPPSQPPQSGTSSPNSGVTSSTSDAVVTQAGLPANPQDAQRSTPKADAPESPGSSLRPGGDPEGSRTTLTGKTVRSSDDEESDSDASLVDLATLLQAKRPATHQNSSTDKAAPSTPRASRFTGRNHELNSSPIVVPKYKFDLKYLASLAKTDDAIEASSKRVKALSTPQEETDALFPTDSSPHEPKPNHLDLLGSVVANREDGEMQRVTRAIKRTEATLSEQRWYFFNTQANPSKDKRQPFPTKAVPEAWRNELLDSKSRYQTFVSGFAEDMVSYGKALPDEIFLWIMDELSREPSDPLRNSYSNTLRESTEQVERLVGLDLIQSLFKGLGGSPTGTSLSQKIRSTPAVVDPYSKYTWDILCTVVKFLGQVARHLQQGARVYTICMLLMMSVDRVVFDNVDVLDEVQETIGRLCRHIPDDAWESCVRSLFHLSIISNIR